MLRILHVAIPTTAGGLERVVEGLAVGHHRRGLHVTVAAIRFGGPPEHPFVESLRARRVTVEVLWLGARAYLGEHRAIEALCRRIRPDVVHTHGVRTDVIDQPAAARLGIPTVTTVHGRDMSGGIKGTFYEWCQRRSYRRFDAVVAVSTALRDETAADGVAPERLHLIHNAWSRIHESLPRKIAREQLGLPDSGPVVGWVGRLGNVKGPDVFLRAIAHLSEPHPIAVVIGYGREEMRLRQLAISLGLGDQVRFFTEIRDAGRYFSAFDTYVLSSRSEGLPIVLFEAMASRVPIVATRVGGVLDVLGETEAWLVNSEDSEGLASAIRESLHNRGEAHLRAHRAVERLQNDFSMEAWLDRYEQVYRQLVAQHATSIARPGMP